MDPNFARQYYESAAAEHWWFKGRKDLVEALLGRGGMKKGLFVDLGAGAESLFPEQFTVVKLDLVRPNVVPNLFVQGSAELLPFEDRTFDGVGVFDVLEHLPHPDVCLAEVRRVVRPGGIVLITVPAYRWLWSPHDDLVGHERRYTVRDVRSALLAAGLTVEWVSAFYGFLLVPASIRAMLSLRSSMVLPRESLNRSLTRVARRSVRRSLRRSTRLGLSIGARATVP